MHVFLPLYASVCAPVRSCVALCMPLCAVVRSCVALYVSLCASPRLTLIDSACRDSISARACAIRASIPANCKAISSGTNVVVVVWVDMGR